MKNTTYILILLGLLLAVACKKDKGANECYDPTHYKCVNFDPCLGKNEVSADFAIEMQVSPGGPLVDSFATGLDQFRRGLIKFRAQENNAQYQWIVGYETLYTQTVLRDFRKVPGGSIIPIQLSVKKEPNEQCFPLDDGKDQKTKKFRLIKSLNELNVMGDYRGVFNGETDSTEISIGVREGHLIAIRKKDKLEFINMFPEDYNATDLFLYLLDSGYGYPKGYIKIDPKNWELDVKYRHTKTKLKLNTDSISFKGRKLN